MDKYLLMLLCHSAQATGEDADKCAQAIRMSITEVNLYQSIKEKEKMFRNYAEERMTRTGYIITVSALGGIASKTMVISGHDILGIQSITAKAGKTCELSLSWRF